MAEVKPMSKIVEKFMRNASRAAPDYKDGCETTKKDQAALAIESAPIYEAALTASFGRDAFQKGLRKSGHSGWKRGATGKGTLRYPQGIIESGPAFQEGFAPHHSALEGITYPPRGPRGSPQNLERVRIENETLHKIRIGA